MLRRRLQSILALVIGPLNVRVVGPGDVRIDSDGNVRLYT